MTRAILINPGDDPTWIDLDADVRAHLEKLLGGLETVVLDREHGEDGPGVKIAINDIALPGRDAPNAFAQSIVESFGQNWRVRGPAVLMWLDGNDVVNLTDERWGWIVNVESGMVAAPLRSARNAFPAMTTPGTGGPASPEFVNVPRAILGPVIDTHIGQMLRGEPVDPKAQIAFAEIFPGGSYRDLDDLVRITAESAFWLAFYADAESWVGSDTRATIAIDAEYSLFAVIHEQAPTTEAYCDHELAVTYDEFGRRTGGSATGGVR